MTAAVTHIAPHVRDRVACVAFYSLFCGPRDPDGNAVEFSYGQAPGPGATDAAP